MPGWYTGSSMTPQLGGGLSLAVLFAIMLAGLLLRSALAAPPWSTGRPAFPPGIRRARPGIFLGLVLGLGGLLLILTVLSLR